MGRLSSETGVSAWCDPVTLYAANRDFGGIATGNARAVVFPQSTEAVARVIQFANQESVHCVVRGRGYSQAGQSLIPDGLVLSTERLDKPPRIEVEQRIAHCGAGVTMRRLVEAAAPHGLVPSVIPLNLDMTLGGLVSAGGIGANSHRHGPVVACVAGVEVVTGAGQVARCTPETQSDLLDAVLGNLGRCGIITECTVELRARSNAVRTQTLQTHTLSDCLSLMYELAQMERAESIESFCWWGGRKLSSGPAGVIVTPQWIFTTTVGTEADSGGRFSPLPMPVNDPEISDFKTNDFIHRYGPRFAHMLRSGQWQSRHPWFESFVEPSEAHELIASTLAELPQELGDGHRIMLVDGSKPRGFMQLPSQTLSVCFAVLPMGVSALESPRCEAALERLDARFALQRSRRYLSGWLGAMDDARWRKHFGERFNEWTASKSRLDPNEVLSSSLFSTPR